MDQQFRLKWNNHCNTLLQVFGNLLKTETLVDCTIGADGQYLKAHKVVVSACSPYFQSLFTEHFDKHPIIILKDIKFAELQSMIDYMYEGEVNISQDQLPSFLKAAASIQLKGLTQNVKPESQPDAPKPVPQLNNAPRGMLSNGSLTPSSMLNVELEEGQQRKKRKMEPHPPSSASSSPSLVPEIAVPNVILDVPGESNATGQNGSAAGENLKKEPSEYSGRSEDEEEDGMSHDGWDLSNDGLHDSNSTLSASDRNPNQLHHGPPGSNRASGGAGNPALGGGPDMSNVDENNQGPMIRSVKARSKLTLTKSALAKSKTLHDVNANSAVTLNRNLDPGTRIQCNYCADHLFTNVQSIYIHAKECRREHRTHKYMCFACDYATYKSTNILRHIRCHLGIKLFQCGICQTSYTQKTRLDYHMLAKHEGALELLEKKVVKT